MVPGIDHFSTGFDYDSHLLLESGPPKIGGGLSVWRVRVTRIVNQRDFSGRIDQNGTGHFLTGTLGSEIRGRHVASHSVELWGAPLFGGHPFGVS